MHDNNKIGKYLFLGIILICTIIFVDQYSKWLVMDNMLRKDVAADSTFTNWFFTRQPVDFFISERPEFNTFSFGPFLNAVMVWNQGISFGLFDSASPFVALIFIAISVTASLLMLIWLAFAEQKRLAIPLAMIIGGALANAIDRVRFGAVADFIDVHIGKYHWPAFNIADCSIAIGAGFLILSTFIADRSNNDKNQ